MKGSPEIIAMLNDRLSEEHAAVQQYTVHASMCKNWGYFKLAEYLFKRAAEEREHALELIDRILFLEGSPDFEKLGPCKVGETVADIFLMDKEAELIAVAGYTEGIETSVKFGDYGTRKLMEHILEEEDSHLNDIESNMSQILQMGIENYLPTQVCA